MPDNQTTEAATLATLDHLDAMAEAWAEECGLSGMAHQIANRVDAADRQWGIEALVALAFVEGAYRLYCRAQDDGMLKERMHD